MSSRQIDNVIGSEKKQEILELTLFQDQAVQDLNNVIDEMSDNIDEMSSALKNVSNTSESATFNIETNLINYLLADGKYVLQNRSQIKQKTSHNYYNKNLYDKEIFSEIWDYLRTEKIAHNSLENLRNTDVFKLSPFKELSEEQISLKQDIIDF